MVKLFKELQSKHKKGFTLFEVLIVVIIMGVLATIALPTYHKVVRKSRVADGLNSLDMLAGAQEKYFIENGQYAQNVTDLKVPFKEYRTGGPYEDIVTTNFTYDNIQGKNCLRAVSNIGGTYTLVKNYRDKEKTFCVGQDCNRLTDFVEEKPEGELNSLCPDDQNQQCTLTDSDCPGNQVVIGTGPSCYCACASIPQCNQGQQFNDVRCQCECPAQAQAICDAQGLTMDPNTCGCIPGSGGGCLDPVPEDRIEKCDLGNPNKECGTKTIKHICDESTGWHVQEVVSDCENVSFFSGTQSCDSQGWKAGCGVRSVQGTCELNTAGTQYQWNITDYGPCEYKDPNYNCGEPGWINNLGPREICWGCRKITCPDSHPVANPSVSNCFQVDTTTYKGFIKPRSGALDQVGSYRMCIGNANIVRNNCLAKCDRTPYDGDPIVHATTLSPAEYCAADQPANKALKLPQTLTTFYCGCNNTCTNEGKRIIEQDSKKVIVCIPRW